MALDHPGRVERVAFLDIVPTHHMLSHIKREWAVDSYHWFFMAQPAYYPEEMLPCGHYPAEQAPAETLAELPTFFN